MAINWQTRRDKILRVYERLGELHYRMHCFERDERTGKLLELTRKQEDELERMAVQHYDLLQKVQDEFEFITL